MYEVYNPYNCLAINLFLLIVYFDLPLNPLQWLVFPSMGFHSVQVHVQFLKSLSDFYLWMG